jgi:hypothetical protein
MWMGQGTENCNEDPKDGFGFVVLSIVYVLAYVNYLYLIHKILHSVSILVSMFPWESTICTNIITFKCVNTRSVRYAVSISNFIEHEATTAFGNRSR